MADLWTLPSNTKLATLEENVTVSINLPLVNNSATVSLISGKLPGGIRISGSQIVGTPYEVPRVTDYRFVLRATLNGETRDRTFIITVGDADAPIWQTSSGLLPVGTNNTFYILDNSPVDFQMLAVDPDLPVGQSLEFFIASGDGQLPPGITLTRDGRLVGVVDPILAIERTLLYNAGTYDTAPYDFASAGYDFGLRSSNGFDSFFYDTAIYDFNYPQRTPKKLNRYYQFTVSASDGDLVSRRTFRIYVVGDDFFRADNTIMQVGTGTFTADNTNIRVPIWLTPGDLGVRRANNYVTLFLDVIDSNNLTGVITYFLVATNPDNTPSRLPPGLELDSSTGEIAGKVPYQAEVTTTFKFTIRAQRFTPDQEEEIVASSKTFTVRLLGEINSETKWVTGSDLGLLASNVISVLRVEATTNVPGSKVIYSLASGRLPPGLALSFDGEIVGKVNAFGENVYKSIWRASRQYHLNDVVRHQGVLYQALSTHQSTSTGTFSIDQGLWARYNYRTNGLTVFDNDTFRLDANTTTVDRSYQFTVVAQDLYKYSIVTKQFVIRISDPDSKKYSNLFMKPFLKEEVRRNFNAFISNPEIFIPEYIYRPSDPNFGIQREVKMLAYPGIETKELQVFVQAMSTNHRRKQYRIGELKSAVAKVPGTNDIVYEVLYLEVIDPAEPSEGRTKKSISIRNTKKINVNSVSATPKDVFYDYEEKPSFTVLTRNRPITVTLGEDFIVQTRDDGEFELKWQEGLEIDSRTESRILSILEGLSPNRVLRPEPEANTIKVDSNVVKAGQNIDNIKYISNITNMRDNIRNMTNARTERNFVPLWMRSAQETSVNELGYTPALVLCYCKPGTSKIIQSAINASDFNFSQFNLDMDRYIIDNTLLSSQPQYLLFANYQFNI
jgi:hypothetical protein